MYASYCPCATLPKLQHRAGICRAAKGRMCGREHTVSSFCRVCPEALNLGRPGGAGKRPLLGAGVLSRFCAPLCMPQEL